MSTQPQATHTSYWKPIDDWTSLVGTSVEVYDRDVLVDAGTVDDVTQDGLIIWLKPYGPAPRRIVDKLHGRHIRRLP